MCIGGGKNFHHPLRRILLRRTLLMTTNRWYLGVLCANPVWRQSSSLMHLPSSGTRGDLQTALKQHMCLSPCLCSPMDCSPLSMGFSGKEYWNGLPFPPPGDLPDWGIEPVSPALACGFFTIVPPEKPNTATSLSFTLTILILLFKEIITTGKLW